MGRFGIFVAASLLGTTSAVAAVTEAALGANTLFCEETGTVGFRWDAQGNVAQGRFESETFTVQVVSDTERVIEWAGMPGMEYQCVLSVGGHHCRERDGEMDLPIIFGEGAFTRAFLFGPQLGGDPNIYISYGTCSKP